MKICKLLIILLFLFGWSSKVDARGAFDFPQNLRGCLNQPFFTATIDLEPRSPLLLTDLHFYGWFVEGDIDPLFGGGDGTLILGQAGPTLTGNVHTLIFRSRNLSTNETYEDVLRIEVFQHPRIDRIEIANRPPVCYGEEVVLRVDSYENVDIIRWIDQSTFQPYSEGHVLTVTEARTFLVVATNAGCDGIQDAQRLVSINIVPPIDTNLMTLREMNWAEICPGCTRRLSDLLAWENSDSLVIDHSTWMLNGNSIAPLNLNSLVGSPPEGRLRDIYVATITGRLYRTNQCRTFTRTLTNFPITLDVSRENCQFQARWLGVADVRLFGGACIDHTIEILNPRPSILNVENVERDIVITSNRNFPISFQSTPSSGVYRFTYRPEDDDTLTITVTYRNICCSVPERFTFTRTLFFETNERIELDDRYCRTDSLHLTFSSNRMGYPSFLFIDSVNILYPYTDSFHLSESSSQIVIYTFKDTIHSWRDRFDEPRAVVHYTYCGVVKTDTIFIFPHVAPELCHPTVMITSIECMGDTNFILITEHRRPNARIDTIIWEYLMPPGVQLIGDLDTLTNYPPDGQTVQFRQRFITYTSAQIRFQILYQESDLDTLIEVHVNQRILPNCSPVMVIDRTRLCRGQETRVDIQLRNRNGRIISIDSTLLIDWDVSHGRDSILLDRINEAPTFPVDVRRTYHHLARFQQTNDFNVVITYNFGDSIREHAFNTQRIIIDNCRAEIWQEDSIRKTYCDGEVARFEIRPYRDSENEIVRVVWDYIPMSPMILDSMNSQTKIWHFYTHVYRDTTFVAFVQEVDFWGDIVNYTLSDYIIVRPFPRIWRHRIIDVCETDTIDLNLFENGIPKFWNPEFITRINVATLPPFNNVNAYAWLSLGDSIRQFVVQGEARFQCASMGGRNTVYDTIYLHWNRPPAVSIVAFPSEGICENDTLRLEIFGADARSIITWLKNDEVIFHERNATDVLWHTVTGSAYYTVISRTACGTVSAREFLTAIPAPPINLPKDTSVCLHDFALLYLPDNLYVVGIAQWHVNEMFIGYYDTLNLQIRDADNPTVVTVLARGYNDCNAKGTIEITPIPLPIVNVSKGGIPGDTVSCVGITEPFSLYVTGDPGLEWLWIYPTPIGLPSTSLVKNVPPTNEDATFRIQGFDPYTGCYNFANFHIVILENDINFTLDMYGNFVADDRACIHANFVFEAEYIPDMTHVWRTLYGRDIHSRFLTIYNVVPADIGSYRLVRNLHSCRDTSWLDIDLMPFPNLQFLGLLPSYCVGNTVDFSVVSGVGVYYEWVDPFGNSIAPHHYKLTDISLAYSGDFLLRTMYNNCWFHDTLRVQVYPLPIIDFTPYYFLCEGFDLTMNMYRPNATFLWCNDYTTPTRRITEGGYYAITIVENNCFSTASVYIEERITPIFRLPNDTAICWNDPRILWADPTIPSEGRGLLVEAIGMDQANFNATEFSWRKNGQLLSHADRFEIFYAGTYTLTTELDGCQWSESILITNVFCDEFVMPNAFRPGSEIEINQTFGPARTFPEELVVFEMFIYDQWGNRKFRTDNQNIRWDGRDMNGRELRPGIFIWVIRAHETLSGRNLSDHGTVALIK